MPNFVDHIKLYISAGNGGNGVVHFRRERHIPKGGPDGGNGGRGGHVILRGNKSISTLLHFRYRKHVHADNGSNGSGGEKTGADGGDVILEVPLGTVVKVAETEEMLGEINKHGDSCLLMRGGRGGKGNVHFKSSTQQTPRYAQPGGVGEEGWVSLELKLLADVGLVGLPNTGKSTLLSVLSAARPKIASYPFTTLTPQLGVVSYYDNRSFVVADIPGIIEGASMGKGLGNRFLRHIERNLVLVLLVDASCTPLTSVYETYKMLRMELGHHSKELIQKQHLLVLNKMDIVSIEDRMNIEKTLPGGVRYIWVSAMNREGIQELKDSVVQMLDKIL